MTDSDRYEFIHTPGCSLSPEHKGDCRAADGSWSRGEWRRVQRLPENVIVDFGQPRPGTSNPMPTATRCAYEDRIRASTEAQAAGARIAGWLFVGESSR